MPTAALSDDEHENLGNALSELDPQVRRLFADSMPSVDFKKISYDRILGDQTNAYLENNPDVPFHEVIDIIRPAADKEYLDQVAHYCKAKINDNHTYSPEENMHPNLAATAGQR